MIQDIFPHKLNISYVSKTIADNDFVIIFKDRSVLVRKSDECYSLPSYGDVKNYLSDNMRYIFTVEGESDHSYFLAQDSISSDIDGFELLPLSQMRYIKYSDFKETYYIVCTAFHLYNWYNDNRFCGRCGKPLRHAEKERMLGCDCCKNEVYPRISPAVIIGVTNGERILMSKYAGRAYKGYALLAGFAEIGETLEQTVQREVMEEVGLKVKNIRYYKSQPGGIDGTLLSGFFCELDGDDSITLDESELACAQWFDRKDIPIDDDRYSLTFEMIGKFKEGKA